MHGFSSRTNNLVESHNARLSKKFGKKAPFFRFVKALAKEDFRKTIQFIQIDSESAVFDQPKKKYTKRTKLIEKAQKALLPGSESMETFFNTVTNSAVKNMAKYDGPADDSDDEVEADCNDPTMCIECKDFRRQVMFGCNHLILCKSCFVANQSLDANLKCTECNTVVGVNYTYF